MTEAQTKDKAAAKLSVIRPGHWRNKWHLLQRALDVYSQTWCEPGVVYGSHEFPSAELAEVYALEEVRANETRRGLSPEYLGPVYFPEPDPL